MCFNVVFNNNTYSKGKKKKKANCLTAKFNKKRNIRLPGEE